MSVFVSLLQRRQSSAEYTPALYVTMEILSNWGSALQVGLTELQFFCLRNKKLFVSPHDLDIRNADYPGNLGALVNGRVKVGFSTLMTKRIILHIFEHLQSVKFVCPVNITHSHLTIPYLPRAQWAAQQSQHQPKLMFCYASVRP